MHGLYLVPGKFYGTYLRMFYVHPGADKVFSAFGEGPSLDLDGL